MTKWKIYNEDAVEWAKNYQKGKFHALLTDAPYHLQSIVKRFGKKNSAPVKVDEFFDGNRQSKGSSPYSRTSKGFMGTQWDGGDVAFRPETWEAFGQVLYPGAFGMAFSASRNWHRMAVAIEDAGFIIHPTMFFLWVNGQGFPKATRVKGHEEFDGHRYGLQALKPAVEPIIVFQKPYENRPVDDITSTGAGALNIDGGRISTDDDYVINRFEDGMKPFGNGAGHEYKSVRVPQSNPKNRQGVVGTDLGISNSDIEKFQQAQRESIEKMESMGRYPSNLVISDGTDNLDGQSKFFYQVSTQLDESDPFLYCAKVSPKERNAGLDDMPDINAGILTNSSGRDIGGKLFCQVCGHRQGACKCDEPEWGHKKPGVVKNNHPTLKPIDLCKYLATLLLPPAEYAPRRIIVPFSGSGSEMIGAGLAGWEHVVGVEFDTENGYVDIAEKRLEHWLKENI